MLGCRTLLGALQQSVEGLSPQVCCGTLQARRAHQGTIRSRITVLACCLGETVTSQTPVNAGLLPSVPEKPLRGKTCAQGYEKFYAVQVRAGRSLQRLGSGTQRMTAVAAVAASQPPTRFCGRSRRGHMPPAKATPQHQHTLAPITGDPSPYGGRCTQCGSSHWLPATDEALSAMQQLLTTICHHGRLDYASSSPDPRFSLDYLFNRGPGRMLGLMLAADTQGQQLVLKAFSGQITESWHIPGEAAKLAPAASLLLQAFLWQLPFGQPGTTCVRCSWLLACCNMHACRVGGSCCWRHQRVTCVCQDTPRD